MVEYGLQHPKKHQKFSIKKWLYLRYVYHHSIEEIGRGIIYVCVLYMHVCVYILSCPLNVMSFFFLREEHTGILEMVVYES